MDATLHMHFRRRTLKAWVRAVLCVLFVHARTPSLTARRCAGACLLWCQNAPPLLLRCHSLAAARAASQVSHFAAHRQELLRREYMASNGGGPPQPPHGFKGQLLACWRHRLSNRDAAAITAGAQCR